MTSKPRARSPLPARRRFLRLAGAAPLAWGLASSGLAGTGSAPAAALARLEAEAGGRLGVSLLDLADGRRAGYRADERFGLCSTYKLLLAGVVLRAIDAGRLAADRIVPFGPDDLVPFAPVVERQLGRGGMTVLELAEAAQVHSDNTAANLLVGLLGGPAAFTARMRTLGDPATRLDRLEPAMNRVPAGEVRDTTTPAAMAASVARLLAGSLLTPTSRERLAAWMVATRTGRQRLRAAFPASWRAGDKTGTGLAPGMVNKANDVAAIWPAPDRLVVVAAYYDAPAAFEHIRDEDDAVLREVGRITVGWIGA